MKIGFVAVLVCILLAGCGRRNIDTVEAVKAGVIRDVGKSVNVAAMDVSVVSVSFRGKEADAVVSFAPKGGTPQQGLTMPYTLERQGDEWHIKSRGRSLQQHAGQAGGGAMGSGGMDSGAMGDGATGADPHQQLPAGHPPLDSSSPR